MGCSHQTEDLDHWKAHCTEHFGQQQELPDILDCFLCEEVSGVSTVGTATAWNRILDHVASFHRENPQVLRPRSPNSIVAILIQRHLVKPADVPGMLCNDDQDSSTLSPHPLYGVDHSEMGKPAVETTNEEM